MRAANALARRITGSAASGVVDALDVEDAGDFLDVQEYFFELLAVADVEENFDACVQLLADAFEVADIGGGIADGGGDFSEHARAVFGEDAEMDREGGLARTSPLNR